VNPISNFLLVVRLGVCTKWSPQNWEFRNWEKLEPRATHTFSHSFLHLGILNLLDSIFDHAELVQMNFAKDSGA